MTFGIIGNYAIQNNQPINVSQFNVTSVFDLSPRRISCWLSKGGYTQIGAHTHGCKQLWERCPMSDRTFSMYACNAWFSWFCIFLWNLSFTHLQRAFSSIGHWAAFSYQCNNADPRIYWLADIHLYSANMKLSGKNGQTPMSHWIVKQVSASFFTFTVGICTPTGLRAYGANLKSLFRLNPFWTISKLFVW